MTEDRSHKRGNLLAAVLLALVAVVVSSSAAEASHFRFAHNTWRRLSGTTVEFTSTQAWRSDFIETLPLDFGDDTGMGIGPVTTIGQFADLAGESYDIVQYKVQHTYAGEGPYTAFIADCCRINSLLNAGGRPERVETVVDLRGGNTGSPVSSIPVILQMARNRVNTKVLPIADPDQDPITCRMATRGESEIPKVASAGANALMVSSNCVLSWDTTGTSLGRKYAAQVAIEEIHGGRTSRVALDFILEIVGAIPPTCSGTSGQHIVNVGQSFMASFTGTDQVGDDLKVNHLGLPPGATLTPPAGTVQSSPFNSTFAWTPQGTDAGTAHAVTIVYSNPMGLEDTCSFSMTIPFLPTPTPSDTPTITPTDFPTSTPTRTPTITDTPTSTPTRTGTAVPTTTLTSTPSQTPTITPTPLPTNTPTTTNTPSAVPTPTAPPSLILRRVYLRADTAVRPGRHNGRIVARGILNVNPPFGGFVGDVLANGLTVRITGAGGVNESMTWPASECGGKRLNTLRPVIICQDRSEPGLPRSQKIRLRPVSARVGPNVFQMSLSGRRREFPPPLTADPVTVVLDTTTLDRRDTIGETGTCRSRGIRRHIAACRELGIIP